MPTYRTEALTYAGIVVGVVHKRVDRAPRPSDPFGKRARTSVRVIAKANWPRRVRKPDPRANRPKDEWHPHQRRAKFFALLRQRIDKVNDSADAVAEVQMRVRAATGLSNFVRESLTK